MGHIDAKILRLTFGFLAPDSAEKLAMSYDFAGVLHQHAQEGIFRRRQFYLHAVELDLARCEIDDQRARLKNGLARFGQRTTLRRAHPGE